MKRWLFITMFLLGLGFLSNYMASSMKLRSDAHETVTFSFKYRNSGIEDPRFTWAKPNKEFIYDGILYDITHIEYLQDRVVIKCHADIQETKIVSKLNLQKDPSHFEVRSKAGGHGELVTQMFLQLPHFFLMVKAVDFVTITPSLKSMPLAGTDPPPEQIV